MSVRLAIKKTKIKNICELELEIKYTKKNTH